jgi:protein CWC15
MTTAHRPTWKAAVGQANEGGWSAGGASSHQRSALDAPAHTKLKVRSGAQAKSDDDRERILQQSLLAMEEAARKANQTKQAVLLGRRPLDPEIEAQGQMRLLKQTAEVDVEEIKKKYDDSDVEGSVDESDLDAPDDDLSDEDDDDSDDEDDEAALQAELAKIRAERETQQQKQEAKAAAEEMAAAQHAAVLGNPLLNPDAGAVGTGRLKRRWNDDVVFRNQAANEPKPQKRFINDTVRNDFHKRFLNKFIR